jgi:hypothetical protein
MRKFLLVLLILVLPAAASARTAVPGAFAQTKIRVGVFGGVGNTLGQSYGLFGVGAGYYLVNGLEVGLDYEAWVFNSPTIQKLTPQLRYVVWQAGAIKPYGGVFWRNTWISDNYPDYKSWGGRLGVAYQQGRSYLALGIVYEQIIDNDELRYSDDSWTYPEISFWFTF